MVVNKVEINTPGELIYTAVKFAVSDQGRIFLEVDRDIYGRVKDRRTEVKGLIENSGVSHKVDWQKVNIVIKEKSGIAEDITL